MDKQDPFWRVEDGLMRLRTPQEFYDGVRGSKSELVGAIYEPDTLGLEDSRRRQMRDKTFNRVIFSRTRIRSMDFRGCKFINCSFREAVVEDCRISHCTFSNTNTYKMEFKDSYVDPKQFEGCLDKTQHQNVGVLLYQALLKNSRHTEQVEFERTAHFLFLRWKRFQDLWEMRRRLAARAPRRLVRAGGRFVSWLLRFLWEQLFGSGVRISYYVRTSVLFVCMATILNFLCRDALGLQHAGVPISSWSQAFYFTVISCTTIGYGDIVPATTVGQIWGAIQGLFGFILFALLASMLFRRVIP